ncbi:unnamed protein product [Phyllotreta striolata]|uniref:Tetratricopeptide repeat protein 12 n=1 Tax=Phyllotreta striolata TaxID=444603 RepID=A0A9N9XIW4_PHYSR|nr:unnamed protein product [Phyllotreta striolata]
MSGLPKYKQLHALQDDEEFNNFMVKVNEVNRIVGKMASKDKAEAEMGDIEAQRYLNEPNEEMKKIIEKIDDGTIELKIRNDRTVINKKAFEEISSDPNTMSQEAFMREVERDANQRYEEKLVRREKMETLKKQATLAFRRGEYEKALTLYNKAIQQIKDSPLLYNNRALTCIKLKLYDKAENDLVEWALHLNEDSLKSWLLLAKVHYLQNKMQDYEKDIKEALNRNPERKEFIEDYVNSQIVNQNSEETKS